MGLQLRLLDRFGDNGIIAIVIGRLQESRDLLIDTWLATFFHATGAVASAPPSVTEPRFGVPSAFRSYVTAAID